MLSSKVFCKKGISTKSLCLNSSLTKINNPIDIELINPPVIIVIIVAVFFGLNFKILNLALPIFVPRISPNGAINPPNNKQSRNILLWRPSDIKKIETITASGGNWVLLIKSATNVLKGDNYVFVSPDLLENKFIVKKGDVITSSILGATDLNSKSINLKIKSLLRETRDEIKSKGSQVSEINTSGNFVKKIRDFLKENQNIKFKLEVVSLRDSKTVEPIVVEINILKIES